MISIMLAVLLFWSIMPSVPVWAAGGSYSIVFRAADPQTYDRLKPSQLDPVKGRAANSLSNASSASIVPSLMPKNLALGQIVAYEIEIAVNGPVAPEDGVITLLANWNTHTTSNKDFGFDPKYFVYSAFVDTADPGYVDPGGDASASHTDWLDGEKIQGLITVSGLDEGDTIFLEVWVVLKSTVPEDANGNVHSGLDLVATAPTAPNTDPETITTSAQTVPLNNIGEFFTENADVGVTKSDLLDPIYAGINLTYTIPVTNHSTDTVSNGVVITDTLDANVSFVSATYGGTYDSATRVVTWPALSLSPGQTVNYTLVVLVEYSAPTANFSGTGPDIRGAASDAAFVPAPDLKNIVRLTTSITDDINTVNNVYQVATNVLLDTTDILVTKVWVDDNNAYLTRPATSISVELLQNRVSYQTATLSSPSWSHTFPGLPHKDSNGDDYTYTVKEITAIPNYATTYSEDNLTITNTLTGLTEISGSKVWVDNDNAYETRPDTLTITLYRNDEAFATKILDIASSTPPFTFSFTNLEKYDGSGKLYTYTVGEADVPLDYTRTQVGNIITNTLTGTTEISGSKVWVDNDNAYETRPDTLTITLYRNGEAFATKILDIASSTPPFTFSFTNLEKYDGSGKLYTYTVGEADADIPLDYTRTQVGNIITNTLDTIDIPVAKVWDDQNNVSGIRPTSITVELLQNSNSFDPAKTFDLDIGNSWSHTFTGLPKLDTSGDAYAYTVKEITAVPYYTTTYSEDVLTITNTYVPGALQVTKSIVLVDVVGTPLIPDFSITITGPSYPTGNTKIFNKANGLTQTWTNLIPGDYTITEASAGTLWTEKVPASAIPVVAGATAAATVTNTQTGVLGVVREPTPTPTLTPTPTPTLTPTPTTGVLGAAKTGESDNLMLVGGVSLLLLAGILIVLRRKWDDLNK